MWWVVRQYSSAADCCPSNANWCRRICPLALMSSGSGNQLPEINVHHQRQHRAVRPVPATVYSTVVRRHHHTGPPPRDSPQCHCPSIQLRLCLTLRQVSATGVQLCRVVQSVREGGKCVTRLVLQLTIADDGWWWIVEMMKSGRARQLDQRYHRGVRKDCSCIAMGSLLFVVGGYDSNDK